MKIILEPTVAVVGVTKFLEHPIYKIPNDGDDAIHLGSFAAKSCYDSFGIDGRSNIDNQRSILESRHGSILEHIHISIFIEGITRALSLELNRHRNLAISQRSTRYVKEEDSAIVLDPYYAELFKKYNMEINNFVGSNGLPLCNPHWFGIAEEEKRRDGSPYPDDYIVIKQFLDSAENSIAIYGLQVKELMELNPLKLSGFDLRKFARGKARNLLPHGLETRALYSASLREWRWVIECRSSKHAEPEIRRLAHVLLQTLKSSVALFFDDFEVSEVYDNIPVYTPKFSKV